MSVSGLSLHWPWATPKNQRREAGARQRRHARPRNRAGTDAACTPRLADGGHACRYHRHAPRRDVTQNVTVAVPGDATARELCTFLFLV